MPALERKRSLSFEEWKDYIRNAEREQAINSSTHKIEEAYLRKHAQLDEMIGDLYVFIHKIPVSRVCDNEVDIAHEKIKEAFQAIRKLIVKIDTT